MESAKQEVVLGADEGRDGAGGAVVEGEGI
jgi:hypothetical protein